MNLTYELVARSSSTKSESNTKSSKTCKNGKRTRNYRYDKISLKYLKIYQVVHIKLRYLPMYITMSFSWFDYCDFFLQIWKSNLKWKLMPWMTMTNQSKCVRHLSLRFVLRHYRVMKKKISWAHMWASEWASKLERALMDQWYDHLC